VFFVICWLVAEVPGTFIHRLTGDYMKDKKNILSDYALLS